MKSRKGKMSRLEKAKTNYSLSLVAYMLHPTEEGKIKMLQFGREFSMAQFEHNCQCENCLNRSFKTAKLMLNQLIDEPN